MLDEPYRWVEAIRNRREYVEDQLRGASPVVAARYADGVLLLTTTPGPRKLFEIYNQVAFAAVGHPADMEKLRKAAIDTAHLEAYNLSPSDVSLHRLVSFGLGPLMKGAFDEILRSPYLARVLMAELDPVEGATVFCTIDADGSFASAADAAALAGTARAAEAGVARLRAAAGAAAPLGARLAVALEAWAAASLRPGDADAPEPDRDAVTACLREAVAALRVEAAVLDRTRRARSRFRLLAAAELEPALAPYRG